MIKQAPRMILSAEDRAKFPTQYTVEELLAMALKMLDSAAEKQRGKQAFLHNNMTLEVIRCKVEQGK